MTEQGSVEHRTTLEFSDLLRNKKNDYEYIYALQEEFDKILDMKEGDSLYFHPNRDDKNSKGIIIRVA